MQNGAEARNGNPLSLGLDETERARCDAWARCNRAVQCCDCSKFETRRATAVGQCPPRADAGSQCAGVLRRDALSHPLERSALPGCLFFSPSESL